MKRSASTAMHASTAPRLGVDVLPLRGRHSKPEPAQLPVEPPIDSPPAPPEPEGFEPLSTVEEVEAATPAPVADTAEPTPSSPRMRWGRAKRHSPMPDATDAPETTDTAPADESPDTVVPRILPDAWDVVDAPLAVPQQPRPRRRSFRLSRSARPPVATVAEDQPSIPDHVVDADDVELPADADRVPDPETLLRATRRLLEVSEQERLLVEARLSLVEEQLVTVRAERDQLLTAVRAAGLETPARTRQVPIG